MFRQCNYKNKSKIQLSRTLLHEGINPDVTRKN
jgi:hypothetical protein